MTKANWEKWIILGSTVALFVTSGGLMLASNMAFKINVPLQNGFLLPGPKGDCWRALPWIGPIRNYTDLCNTFVDQGASKANIQVCTLNCQFGSYTCANCLLGGQALLPVGAGVRIRITGTTTPASPLQVILDGSHDETAVYPTFYGSFIQPGPKGDCWVAPPYHTTWLKASDVCAGLGLTLGQGNVSRLDCTTGVVTTFTCGLTANNFDLRLGEAIRVRKVNAGNIVGIIPPHF